MSEPASGDPHSDKVHRLIGVVDALGSRNVEVLDEIKQSNRQQRRTNVLVLVLTCVFVGGAVLNYLAVLEWQAARADDRFTTLREIDAAATDIRGYVDLARRAADRAADHAQRATAESVIAQAEAVETQVRLVPPRERPRIQQKSEARREKAQEILNDTPPPSPPAVPVAHPDPSGKPVENAPL